MLAARYDRHGPSHEVLRVEEVATPEPGPGEVRVRNRVSGVNPTDWKQRAGGGRAGGLTFDFQVPDQDGAGVVDAVGEGADAALVGRRVWVFFASYRRQWGTAAQFSVLPAEHVVRLPDGASDDLGAHLGIPALTAHRCLHADGPVAGRTVLVAGGAGAVGHFAIELARWGRAGTIVATVSGDEKAALARAAGADVVVDYTRGDPAAAIRDAAPGGVDRIVEVALHRNLALDAQVTAPHAAIAAYANGGRTDLSVADLMTKNVTARFVLVYTMPPDAVRDAVRDVSAAVADGALTVLPIHRFALEQIADAHDAVEQGAVGKVLVDVP